MKLGKLAIAAVVMIAGASACSHEEQADAKTAQKFSAMAQTSRVDTGGSFSVAVTSPLSSETSEPGDVFTARLRAPLLGTDGQVIAPAGAPVWGHVVAADRGARPRLALSFDSIDTVSGSKPIHARLAYVDDEKVSISGMRAPGEAASDVVLQSTPPRAIGGGPKSEAKPGDESKEECATQTPAAPKTTVTLKPRTTLNLTLTGPLDVMIK